jgi:hypothetical protein
VTGQHLRPRRRVAKRDPRGTGSAAERSGRRSHLEEQ